MQYALCWLLSPQSELCKWTPATTAVRNIQSISARAKYGIIVHIVMLRWVKCMHMIVGEPSSLPTHMLVAEVVGGEDHRVTCCWRRTSLTTHPLSWVQFILCERGVAVDGGVPYVDEGQPHDSLTPHSSASISVHNCRVQGDLTLYSADDKDLWVKTFCILFFN